jgi:ankyrin repeat protein
MAIVAIKRSVRDRYIFSHNEKLCIIFSFDMSCEELVALCTRVATERDEEALGMLTGRFCSVKPDVLAAFWKHEFVIDGERLVASAMHLACYHGHMDLIRLLMKFPCLDDPLRLHDANLNIPLLYAARKGHTEVARYILKTQAVARGFDDVASYIAHRESHIGCYQQPAPRPYEQEGNSIGQDALHIAAKSDQSEMIRCLVENGASMSSRDNSMRTALLLACSRGHYAASKTLIELGACTGVRDIKGRTALHHAACLGDASLVSLLIQSGIVKDRVDDRLYTPVHLAAYHGHYSCVVALIEGGLSSMKSNEPGDLPIHSACRIDNTLPIVEYLYGVSPECVVTRNSAGHFPVQTALRHGNPEAAEFLLNHTDVYTQMGFTLIADATRFGIERGLFYSKGVHAVVLDDIDTTSRRLACIGVVFRMMSRKMPSYEFHDRWQWICDLAASCMDVASLMLLASYDHRIRQMCIETHIKFRGTCNVYMELIKKTTPIQIAAAACYADRVHDLLLCGSVLEETAQYRDARGVVLTYRPTVLELEPHLYRPSAQAVHEMDELICNARLPWMSRTHAYMFGPEFQRLIATVCLVKVWSASPTCDSVVLM